MDLPVPDALASLAERLLAPAASLLVAGVALQAYQAGQATLAANPTWGTHVAVGHGLSALAVGVVVLAYLGPAGARARRLAWLALVSYYATVGLAVFRFTEGMGAVAALHPVAALATFLAATLLAMEAAGRPAPGLGGSGARADGS